LSFGKINGILIQCNFGKRQNQRHKHFNKNSRSNQFDDEFDGSQDSGNIPDDLNFNCNANINSYMNKTQVSSTTRMNNGISNMHTTTRNRGTTIDPVYDTNQALLDLNTFSNGLSNNSFQPSLTQFNSLPPGPYLAPPAMYGKTLEALASTSPSYTSYSASGPSPALSPPNLNNFPMSLSPPNALSQSSSNLLLLSPLNPLSTNTNSSLGMNLGMTTNNGLINQPSQITNFANLITLLPSSTLSQLQQSLSSNWGTLQNLNSVTSIPSVTNPFTTGPSVHMNNSIPQSSSFYNTFPLNFGTKNMSFSPSGFPMKDSLVTQK